MYKNVLSNGKFIVIKYCLKWCKWHFFIKAYCHSHKLNWQSRNSFYLLCDVCRECHVYLALYSQCAFYLNPLLPMILEFLWKCFQSIFFVKTFFKHNTKWLLSKTTILIQSSWGLRVKINAEIFLQNNLFFHSLEHWLISQLWWTRL